MTNLADWYYQQADQFDLLTKEEEIELSKIIKGDSVKKRDEAREHMIKANLKLVIKIANNYKTYGLELEDLISEGNIGLCIAVDKYDADKGTKFSTYAGYWIRQKIMRALSEKSRCIRFPVHLTQDFSKILKFVEKFKANNKDREPSIKQIAVATKVKEAKVKTVLHAYENVQASVSLDSPLNKDELGEASVGDKIEDILAMNPFKGTEAINNSDIIFKFLKKLDERERHIICHRFGLDGSDVETLEKIGEAHRITRERVRQLEKAALEKLRVMFKKQFATHS